MNKNILEKAIGNYLKASKQAEVAGISFYGGEPLLKFELIEHAISFINDKHQGQNIQYTITTNGLLLSNKIIDFLIENDFLITISLDGPKDLHDRYRVDHDNNGTYDRIVNNLKKIKHKNPTFYDSNIRYNSVLAPPIKVSSLFEFFKKDNVNFLELNMTKEFMKLLSGNVEFTNVDEEINMNTNDSPVLLDYLKQLKRYHRLAKENTGNSCGIGGFCDPIERKIFVNSSGKYLLCERIDESDEKYWLGDVFTGININKVKKLINSNMIIWDKNCKSCWACRLCKACNVNFNDIDYYGEYCKKMRDTIEREFLNYLTLVNDEPSYLHIFDKVTID